MADEVEKPPKTPHTTLIEALERVEDMEDVLIIWMNKKTQTASSIDSDLTVGDTLLMVELYKTWVLKAMLEK
jgi:hypothetical protein